MQLNWEATTPAQVILAIQCPSHEPYLITKFSSLNFSVCILIWYWRDLGENIGWAAILHFDHINDNSFLSNRKKSLFSALVGTEHGSRCQHPRQRHVEHASVSRLGKFSKSENGKSPAIQALMQHCHQCLEFKRSASLFLLIHHFVNTCSYLISQLNIFTWSTITGHIRYNLASGILCVIHIRLIPIADLDEAIHHLPERRASSLLSVVPVLTKLLIGNIERVLILRSLVTYAIQRISPMLGL